MSFRSKIWMAALAGLLCLGGNGIQAQDNAPGGAPGGGGRRGFDPEQMRQRMMERYREQFDVKDDAEWKLISERITKVMEAQRDVGFGMGMGFGRGGGGRRPGGEGAPAPAEGADAGARRGPRGFGGEPSPEGEALQQAIESKASKDEIKTKLAKYRESKKAKEAKLDKSREELREVLDARQEAVAVLNGLLK